MLDNIPDPAIESDIQSGIARLVEGSTHADVVAKLNELVEVANKIEALLTMISEQVGPAIESLKDSTIGKMLLS